MEKKIAVLPGDGIGPEVAAQAVKALKEEGYEVVLINSNPATIMTDPEFADARHDVMRQVCRSLAENQCEKQGARYREHEHCRPDARDSCHYGRFGRNGR